MLDQFVVKPNEAAGEEPRIIMNEDGTIGDSEMADDFM
jgi:hypothetical protein